MANIEKRIGKHGRITYRVKIRLRGHPTQHATFDRLTDAKKWAQSTESAIREGRHFKTIESKRHTFGELIDRYIKNVLPNKGSSPKQQSSQANQLNWWKEQIGDFLLADITPAMIAEKRDELLLGATSNSNERKPATVNRYLAILSHTYTIAVKEWGWVEDSPLRKVTKLKEPRGRVRFLSDDERERLLYECSASPNPYVYVVLVLALSTGARHGEIMGVRWADIDMKRNCITLHQTKNGERRLLPLTGHALELIKKHAKIRRLDTDLVFPNRRGTKSADIRAPFVKCLQKAEINDFRFHDLRHSAASYLAMNGASLAEIAEVLGHKTLQMVKRYAHLSDAHTSDVVASMNKKIFG